MSAIMIGGKAERRRAIAWGQGFHAIARNLRQNRVRTPRRRVPGSAIRLMTPVSALTCAICSLPSLRLTYQPRYTLKRIRLALVVPPASSRGDYISQRIANSSAAPGLDRVLVSAYGSSR